MRRQRSSPRSANPAEAASSAAPAQEEPAAPHGRRRSRLDPRVGAIAACAIVRSSGHGEIHARAQARPGVGQVDRQPLAAARRHPAIRADQRLHADSIATPGADRLHHPHQIKAQVASADDRTALAPCGVGGGPRGDGATVDPPPQEDRLAGIAGFERATELDRQARWRRMQAHSRIDAHGGAASGRTACRGAVVREERGGGAIQIEGDRGADEIRGFAGMHAGQCDLVACAQAAGPGRGRA
jgi:hypothetical protein